MHQCNAHNINDAPRLTHLGAFIIVCKSGQLTSVSVKMKSKFIGDFFKTAWLWSTQSKNVITIAS